MSAAKGRTQFLLIVLIFLGPLAIAAWLYFAGGAWQPVGRSNHGALLEPIVNLRDTLPASPLHAGNDDHWLMLYRNEGDCDASCRDALYRLRQSRLMLGNDMDRVRRVFLHGDTPPDTLILEVEHAGLITISDKRLGHLLTQKIPAGLDPGGIFLVDPLGNLVMYFAPDLRPRDMVDDIHHLLDLSRIG